MRARLACHRLDHRGVVDEDHLPALACPLTSEAQHRLGIAVGHAGEEETGIPPARARGDVRPLDEHAVDPSCAQVTQEADAYTAAPADYAFALVTPLPYTALRQPPPPLT